MAKIPICTELFCKRAAFPPIPIVLVAQIDMTTIAKSVEKACAAVPITIGWRCAVSPQP
jgi:hypothetical protein